VASLDVVERPLAIVTHPLGKLVERASGRLGAIDVRTLELVATRGRQGLLEGLQRLGLQVLGEPLGVALAGDAEAFVNACRLIIVDGTYAVSTDMENYFFGLVGTDTASATTIPTGSTSTNPASSPLPTVAIETNNIPRTRRFMRGCGASPRPDRARRDAVRSKSVPTNATNERIRPTYGRDVDVTVEEGDVPRQARIVDLRRVRPEERGRCAGENIPVDWNIRRI